MKVGVLGAGAMGEAVVGHLRDCPEVTGIITYDRTGERARELAERHDITWASDLSQVISDQDVRLVFVTSSQDAHAELTLASLDAGKAVMCEKPMATSLTDAVSMVRRARQTGGFLQIGFELRYSKLYTTVKEWVDAGLLGELLVIQCTYISSEYWGPSSWRTKRSSGGMFGEKLSHYVDLPRWWVGAPVREVYSASAPNAVPYFQVRDNYQTTCCFANGAVSHLSFMMALAASRVADPLRDTLGQQHGDGHELRFLVEGTKGAAETNAFGRSIKRWAFHHGPGGFESTLVDHMAWSPEEDHMYFHNTTSQAHDVVRRVLEGRGPSISPEDSLSSTLVCHAAEVSSDEGRPVLIDEIAPGTDDAEGQRFAPRALSGDEQ